MEGAGIVSTELNDCENENHVVEITQDEDGNPVIIHDDSGKYHALRAINSGWGCCSTCLDCLFKTQNRLLYTSICFIISMIVLIFCIVDLIVIRSLPNWSSSSMMAFIVGLWSPNPGESLLKKFKGPKKSILKEPKKLLNKK